MSNDNQKSGAKCKVLRTPEKQAVSLDVGYCLRNRLLVIANLSIA